MKKNLILIMGLALHFFAVAQKNITLTATYQKDKKVVLIQWQHLVSNVASYTLQSSKDNIFFSDIFIKQNNGILTKSFINYADKTTTGEKIYYRLKINLTDSIYEITLPIMVTLNITNNNWLIYPLPATEFLNLKYTGNGIIDGIVTIYIQSMNSGTILTRLRLASNTKTIIVPITNLGRGIYNIQVAIGSRPAWNQQFIK
jgi:hypothetical protein